MLTVSNFSIKGGSHTPACCCLPAQIKKCLFNIRFSYPKNQCLFYAIAASHYKKKHRTQQNLRSFVNSTFKNLNKEKVKLNSIPKLERQYDLSINIFSWNKEPIILYTSENTIARKINLLLYKGHYSLMTNINVFFGSSKSHKVYVCEKCLIRFRRHKHLKAHRNKCCFGKHQKYSVPPVGTKINFKNFSHQIKNNFVIYADFEAVLVDRNIQKGNNTLIMQEHEAVAFAGKRICSPNKRFNSIFFLSYNSCVKSS